MVYNEWDLYTAKNSSNLLKTFFFKAISISPFISCWLHYSGFHCRYRLCLLTKFKHFAFFQQHIIHFHKHENGTYICSTQALIGVIGVIGSWSIVWCNIRPRTPMRLDIAMRMLRSCSKSSSSFIH